MKGGRRCRDRLVYCRGSAHTGHDELAVAWLTMCHGRAARVVLSVMTNSKHSMRTKIAALAATVFLTGAALATASPAWASDPGGGASWDHTWTTSDAAHGGTVYIAEHGDVVELCDTAADGYAPRVEIFAQASNGQYNSRYILTASDGFGTCATRSASNGGIYDLPENDNIAVSIWLGPSVGFDGSEHYYLNDN